MKTTPVAASNIRLRRSFAKTKHLIDIPNLIELQKKSYEAFGDLSLCRRAKPACQTARTKETEASESSREPNITKTQPLQTTTHVSRDSR